MINEERMNEVYTIEMYAKYLERYELQSNYNNLMLFKMHCVNYAMN